MLDKAAILEFFADVREAKLEAVPEPDELDPWTRRTTRRATWTT